MVDKFAPAGNMLCVEYSDGSGEILYTSNSRETAIPVVVLVNEMTFGAGEVFAACLRDFGLASIVGAQTGGYGSLQEIYKLDDGSAIQLTIGKYYLANSATFWEGTGITPDHIVEYNYNDLNFTDITLIDSTSDSQIAKAMEVASAFISVDVPEENEGSGEKSSEG